MSSNTTRLYHFINGQKVAGSSGRSGDIYNPAIGAVTKQVPLASKSELENAIAVAQKAFASWSATLLADGHKSCLLFVI